MEQLEQLTRLWF
jgi:hypothetical protein